MSYNDSDWPVTVRLYYFFPSRMRHLVFEITSTYALDLCKTPGFDSRAIQVLTSCFSFASGTSLPSCDIWPIVGFELVGFRRFLRRSYTNTAIFVLSPSTSLLLPD